MGNVSLTYTDMSTAAAVQKVMVGNHQNSGQFDVSVGKKNIIAYAVWLFEQDFW